MAQTQATAKQQPRTEETQRTRVQKLASDARKVAVFAAKIVVDTLKTKEPTTQEILEQIECAPPGERERLLRKYGDRLSGAT